MRGIKPQGRVSKKSKFCNLQQLRPHPKPLLRPLLCLRSVPTGCQARQAHGQAIHCFHTSTPLAFWHAPFHACRVPTATLFAGRAADTPVHQ